MNETLQIIVAVLGILSQVLVLGREFYGKDAGKAHRPNTETDHTSERPAKDKRQARSLLDLSFVLICAAFFSLLLTDSFIISGQKPSPGSGTILTVSIITAVIVGTMVWAWFLHVTEMVTGFLAVTTLLVLIFSSGGPFFTSETDAVVGLSLLIPMVSLVTLASTMFIYSFGNPLNRAFPRRNRLVISLTLLALVLVSSGALGKKLLQNVTSDARTPTLNSPEAKNLYQSVMKGSPQDQRNFYRLASEVNLAQTYRDHYHEVAQERQSQIDDPSPTASPKSTPQEPSTLAPPSVSQAQPQARPQQVSNANVNLQAGGEDGRLRPQPTPTPKNLPEALEQKRQLDRLISRAYQRGVDADTISFLEQESSYYDTSFKISKELGVERLNFLARDFAASDLLTQEKYLTNRLNFIHPIGLENQSEATIPLPGRTAEERFITISNHRIFLALDNQQNLRRKILSEFEYPPDVAKYFRDIDKVIAADAPQFSGEEAIAKKLNRPSLFPRFVSIDNARLKEQLSLPLKEEAYVAYRAYKQHAAMLIKQEFKGKVDEARLDGLITAFNQLDDAAQNAFLHYVINNKKIDSETVLRMLIDLREVNFEALTNSTDHLAVKTLSSMVSGSRLSDNPELQELADKISQVKSGSAKETLLELLRSAEDGEVSIKQLFQEQVFDLVGQMDALLGRDKTEFFNAVADPVWLVARHFARTRAAQSVKPGINPYPVDAYLDTFKSKLSDEEQAGLLLQMAISSYQTGGDHSLDPVRLLVAQAKTSWSETGAFFCATVLALPIMLLCIFVGGFFSRKLVARDRTRELVSQEATGVSGLDSAPGTPVELWGRDDVLGSLRSLAERGWSTIGVVGRRGVGKSRILYSLSKERLDEESSPTVKVWVSSPSRFQEEDFIYSVFERLALSTEGVVASFLGAKPLSIRTIEARAAQVGALFYLGALIVLGGIVYEMYDRLSQAEIVITWLPILALLFTSVWLFFSHVSKLQPVNLSSWLQRDRTQNSHTVMLYREVYDILKTLRRRARGFAEEGRARSSLLRLVGMTLLGVTFFVAAFILMVSLGNPMRLRYFAVALAVSILSLVGWVYLYHNTQSQDDRSVAYSHSVMSLIADYRAFAATIVYRLRQGALGHRPERKFSVLICIDELDKIVDFEEIRAYVRRVKAIFEVPGVYYYVSLAEDTLTALYLGPAEGKNEIDSAFDHIVRIPPLSCDAGEKIAAEYLTAHGMADPGPKLARTVSTISYGIPRDIIRRCDELIARGHSVAAGPDRLAYELRLMQVNIGYELRQLTKTQADNFSKGYLESAWHAQSAMNNGITDEAVRRLILSLWLLSLVEGAAVQFDGEQWRKATEELCNIGYRLPVDPVSDLRPEIDKLHYTVLGHRVEALGQTLSSHN